MFAAFSTDAKIKKNRGYWTQLAMKSKVQKLQNADAHARNEKTTSSENHAAFSKEVDITDHDGSQVEPRNCSGIIAAQRQISSNDDSILSGNLQYAAGD